jgi:predicted O-methyltransferase YrrM
MLQEEAPKYVLSLYQNLLRRNPGPDEFKAWVKTAQGDKSALEIYYLFINSNEYKSKTRVNTIFPIGHYYSPIVDPSTVRGYVEREQRTVSSQIAGIDVPLEEMEAFWKQISTIVATTSFPESKDDNHRFYYSNSSFPYGDAIALRAMIGTTRPRNIIEIGSGFSSACMLDSVDEFHLDTRFTFVDPDATRLRSLLKPADYERAEIFEIPVQQASLAAFRSLCRGDFLFIDSTHVLKTGSDVHFELFHILPALASGVIVHFHDIQFPFEYPDPWIFDDNFSWNEIYGVRAFLMFNSVYRIKFWGSCLARERTELIRATFPLFLKNPGGSLWLEKR